MFRKFAIIITAAAAILAGANSNADLIWTWDNNEGLSAYATVSQADSDTLRIVVENTSTAWPSWMPADSSNQILTSISFELPAGLEIVGGSAILGDGAVTIDFDDVGSQLSAGDDVSGEWGFGNDGGKVNLARNFITAMTNHSTAFGGANLDGPSNLNGPQGGLVANPLLFSLGGLGAIRGPVVFELHINGQFDLLQVTRGNIEFGSDAAFVGPGTVEQVPEPTTATLLALGGVAFAGGWLRRRFGTGGTAG